MSCDDGVVVDASRYFWARKRKWPELVVFTSGLFVQMPTSWRRAGREADGVGRPRRVELEEEMVSTSALVLPKLVTLVRYGAHARAVLCEGSSPCVASRWKQLDRL